MPAVITPEILDLLDCLRDAVLTYEEAMETTPWGSHTFCRSMDGRYFLIANAKPDHLELTFQVLAHNRAKVLDLPWLAPGKFMDDRGWLTAKVSTPKELEPLLPWILVSYELSKPFRRAEEALPGENPLPLAFLEQVRTEVMSYNYGKVEEYFPFGSRAFRRMKGQIFLYADACQEYLYAAVRLPLGEREYALSLPYVDIPAYIGPKGWISARVRNPAELDTLMSWLPLSFDMNVPARKSKTRR